MKHSIAKSVLFFTLLISLTLTGTMVFFAVITAQDDAYEHSQLKAYHAAQTVALMYDELDQNTLFNDEDERQIVQKSLQNVLDEESLLFLYIVVPNTRNNTLTYHYLVGIDDVQDVVDEIMASPVQHRTTISDAMCRVMEGESPREDIEIDNDFGNVITTYIPLVNEDDGVIAVVGADVSTSIMTNLLLDTLPHKLLVCLLIGVLGPILMYLVMKKTIIEPTQKTSLAMNAFGKNGNYDVEPIPIESNNEIGMIATSFNEMAENIRDNIAQIEKYTEIQNRQKYELAAASEIQQGFLPAPHLESDLSEINGCMIPAKDVGGDFFDYFEHQGKSVLLIADVSGKGLSGALFMTSAITLIRAFVKQSLPPHKVLETVNKELEQTNPNMMFVTAFLAYVDAQSQTLSYSNAGHNAPYLLIDGKLEKLTGSGGMPLGVMPDETYETSNAFLPLGSTLFLYTDGVNEAMNAKQEFFGYGRLEGLLRASNGEDAILRVRGALESFAEGADPHDDVTMLTYTSKAEKLVLPAQKAHLADLHSWILQDVRIPEKLKMDLSLMAEEIFINIASYAYDGENGEVAVRKQVQDGICSLQFSDSGVPFNPKENVTDIESYDPFSRVGGLGCFMVESLADVWHYANIEGRNIQFIVKRREEPSKT